MKKLLTILVAAAFAMSCSEHHPDVEIIPIQDNANPRLMPRALFAEAPDSLFEALGLQDGVPSSVCAFLVKTQGKNILFDAANGAQDSRLMSVLESHGVVPEDIDYIFLTHMHGDHIGGLLKDGEAAFPEAEININQVEFDAWKAAGEEQYAALSAIAEAYYERFFIFPIGEELPCGVEAIAAYGHTPGHTAYRIGDALIVGDIMHGVALQLEHPQYCARFDGDHEQAVSTRKTLLQMGKDQALTLYGMHFPEPYFIK